MPRYPIFSVGLLLLSLLPFASTPAQAWPWGPGGWFGDDAQGPDQTLVENAKIIPAAEKEFKELHDRTAKRFPNDKTLLTMVDRTHDYFVANAKEKLKHPEYHQFEIDYIGGSLHVIVNQLKGTMDVMRRGGDKDEINRGLADVQHRASKDLTDLGHTMAMAQVRSETPGGAPPMTDEEIRRVIQNSDVVKLVREAAKNSVPQNPEPPEKPTNPPTPSRPDHSGGGATPNSPSSDPSGMSSIVTPAAGAQGMAEASAAELDAGQYAQAYSDAKTALQFDPANKDAMTVMHFAEGRAGASSPSGGAEPNGGAGLSGGERGFAGGERAAGAATFGAAARGLTMTPAARLASEQAQKAAQNALSLRDTAGALALVNRALEADPNNPALLNQRAAVYLVMRDYRRASADAAAGLALEPGNKALLRTKGFADLRAGNYKDALGSANELLEQDPKDSFAFALRGHAYGNMGDRDAMMADLRSAAGIDPRYAAAAARAGTLQLPSDNDILFLFPGEQAAAPASQTAAVPSSRNKKFGILVGVSAFGGLLLALGLLQTFLAPLKKQVSSVFTRLTRTGPSVASLGDGDTAQPASVNGLMPGLIRGQYEISRQIGQGGMGTVFEGTDRALGRRVAIKKMREELRVNPQERARFVIEAKTVAALHHPSIVDIYSIAEDGQDVYLIFEFVDGKTVHDLVQTAGRLSLKDAARVTRAAADALGYAHSRGVIHRDMKPSNMMIDATGQVKVMDFGIARMAKDAMTRYSMTNTVVGTPPYMAPEQEQGQVRKESDVYALAVCAYEMLTGKLPFIGIGAGMLMNKINMSYVSPSHAIAGLPAALDAVFTKAFQAAPENRYRTPAEFADALETALGAGAKA